MCYTDSVKLVGVDAVSYTHLPLEQLDVEQTLARLTAREEQGVTFANITTNSGSGGASCGSV